jgi:hypothetical protein
MMMITLCAAVSSLRQAENKCDRLCGELENLHICTPKHDSGKLMKTQVTALKQVLCNIHRVWVYILSHDFQ